MRVDTIAHLPGVLVHQMLAEKQRGLTMKARLVTHEDFRGVCRVVAERPSLTFWQVSRTPMVQSHSQLRFAFASWNGVQGHQLALNPPSLVSFPTRNVARSDFWLLR